MSVQVSSVQLRRSVRASWGVHTIQQTSSKLPAANVFKIHVLMHVCWKFAGRLLDRVNTLLTVRDATRCHNLPRMHKHPSAEGVFGDTLYRPTVLTRSSSLCY